MKKKQTMFVSMKGTSTIIQEEETTLTDGRAIKIQLWKEAERTYITYFFPIENLEEHTKEELYYYLIEHGIKLDAPFSKGKVNVQKFMGANKELWWGFTIVANKIIEK